SVYHAILLSIVRTPTVICSSSTNRSGVDMFATPRRQDGVVEPMRYTSDIQRRGAFRDWLRNELAELDFYLRRGDRYLVSEFARYADSLGARVEEVSLGRYLRDENPVLPTPESCRELARALGRHSAEVLIEAGYLLAEDFIALPSTGVNGEELGHRLDEIDGYTILPDSIRVLIKAGLKRQREKAEFERALGVIEPLRESHGTLASEMPLPAEEANLARHPTHYGGPNEG